MSEFKKGDIVERILFDNEGAEPGSIGIVVGGNGVSEWYDVDFDGKIGSHLSRYLRLVRFAVGDIYESDGSGWDIEVMLHQNGYIITKELDDGTLVAYEENDEELDSWKLVKNVKEVELTLSEIADKFNIDVEKLRIKD